LHRSTVYDGILPTVAVTQSITWTEFSGDYWYWQRPEIWSTFIRPYVCWRTFKLWSWLCWNNCWMGTMYCCWFWLRI